jgi:hypothetical protein
MQTKRVHRHIVSHTLEHVFLFLAVFSTAIALSFVGESFGVRDVHVMADASGSSLAIATPSVASDPVEVTFSVQPGPATRCETGSPVTPVFFLVTKANAGSFVVSSDSGMNNARFDWGEFPLPNGNYTWKAVVKDGFVSVGDLSGTFEIKNSCAQSQAVSRGGVGITPMSPLPINPFRQSGVPQQSVTSVTKAPVADPFVRPTIKLFVDNKALPQGKSVNKEQVEIRMTTTEAVSVNVSSVNAIGVARALGSAEKDDLLSTSGSDVWTYTLDAGKTVDGIYKLFATAVDKSGRSTTSEELKIDILHVVPTASAKQATTPANTKGARATQAEKQAILARIADPASCANQEECLIYCKNFPDEKNSCTDFVNELIAGKLYPRPSLADGIQEARLLALLSPIAARPKDLPLAVTTPEKFGSFCAEPAHRDLCTRILLHADIATTEMLDLKSREILRAHDEGMHLFTERIGARMFIDTDGDGITDFDEVNIFHTDPLLVDTDRDGFPDGAELLARTNPRGGFTKEGGEMGTSSEANDESTTFEDPTVSGIAEPQLLFVQNVRMSEERVDHTGTTRGGVIKFEGTAPPNSFVTLYVFSQTIAVTIKTDATGGWVYDFDKELPNGEHTVFAALTDERGHILAKSDPFIFVKDGARVLSSTAASPTESGKETSKTTWVIACLALLLGAIGIVVSFAGYIKKRKVITSDVTLPGI